MKKVFTTAILAVFLFLAFSPELVRDQDNIDLTKLILEGRGMIQKGVNLWKLDTLLSARGIFERISSVDEKNYLCHYYFAYADYRLCVIYSSRKDNDNASIYIEEGIKHIEKSIDLPPIFRPV